MSAIILELALFIPAKTLISVQNSNVSYLKLFLHSGRMQIGVREIKKNKVGGVGDSGVNICPTTPCFTDFFLLSLTTIILVCSQNGE